jgi:hypothetical protein
MATRVLCGLALLLERAHAQPSQRISSAPAYGMVWPSEYGYNGVFGSAVAGIPVSSSIQSGTAHVQSVPLPPRSSASQSGSSVVLDSHAVYVLSGAGAPGWCAVNYTGALSELPNTTLTAVGVSGSSLWSTQVPSAADVASLARQCDFRLGAWVEARIVLHPNLPLIFASGTCAMPSKQWGAWAYALNTTNGAVIWTKLLQFAESPPPSIDTVAGCASLGASAFTHNFALAPDPVSNYLVAIAPNASLGLLDPLSGNISDLLNFKPPFCGPSSSSAVSSFNAIGPLLQAPFPPPTVVAAFMCFPQRSNNSSNAGTAVNFTLGSVQINAATGSFGPLAFNGSVSIPGLIGGVGNALNPLCNYWGTAQQLKYSCTSPTAGLALLPQTTVFTTNGSLMSAVSTSTGVLWLSVATNVTLLPNNYTSISGSPIDLFAYNATTQAMIAVMRNVTNFYPRSSNGSPWSQLPMTATADGSVCLTTLTPQDAASQNCLFSVLTFALVAGSGVSGICVI